MHIPLGQLRAYHDQQLDPAECRLVRDHLKTCSQCQNLSQDLLSRSERVESRLQHLDETLPASFLPAQTARTRLNAYIQEKESSKMWNKMFSPRYRTAWIALAIIAALAVSLTFAPVRALAIDFLGLFRVEQIAVVEIDPNNLQDSLNGSSASIEQLFAENVEVEGLGNPQVVADAAEASNATGIPIRLPGSMDTTPELQVQPGGRMTFTFDMQRVRSIMEELGQEIDLPDGLDGALITADIPAAAIATYGDCQIPPHGSGFDPDDPDTFSRRDCTTLIQMSSPSVNAPPGLDIDGLMVSFLTMTGMTQEDAVIFTQNVDLSTTLVIPVPVGAATSEIEVDGVTGVFIQEPQGRPPQFMLIWVKDGTLYALSGQGDESEALSLADALE